MKHLKVKTEIMKTNKLHLFRSTTILITFLATFSSIYASGSNENSIKEKTIISVINSYEEPPKDEVKTKTLQFKKGKVYQILFYTINKNNQNSLFTNFFSKALPIWEKHGRKHLGSFDIIESRSESLQSSSIAIFEWPSFKTYEKVESNEEFKKAAIYRNGGFTFFKNGWFETDKDLTVEIREDKVYEFAGATLLPTQEAQESLNKYFEISEPIKRSYGGSYPQFLAKFKPVHSKGNATYSNGMQLIVEWDSVEDNRMLFENEEFKTKAAPLMMKAIINADFVFTKFKF